jgi:hypothetical protein
MRVSADKDDPGYSPLLQGCRVFYEGYQRSGVFTADEEKRLAIVAKLDHRGQYILNAERDGIERETIYGHIRIEADPKMLEMHKQWKSGRIIVNDK